ncbi:MerR family transcriptional regulator [Fusibacter ferrireducens]|uniref:GyrI-like domain-containing protein n=1 Tax=Fusibacter ferrireducens TaxID=2785058 RepID=A0ABR9ZQG9_9FIRM|nr:MerR family transcriptional regulator [Fusibacter ferrireducens]MBF4692388.1 GyrI-like domain-containing protein [Fusibacter ferrireducens]
MYKIGEFSKITFLSVKTLRYYNEIKLLVPAKIDEATGYRYYDDENFQKAMMIKTLRRFNFSIQELLEVLPRIDHMDDLADFLLEKHEQLETQVTMIKRDQKALIKEVNYMKEVKAVSKLYEVEIVNMPAVKVACLRYKGRYEDLGIYIGKLYKAAGMNAEGAPFSLYYDEDYMEADADIEVAVPVKKEVKKDEVKTRMLPEIRCVKYVHVGPYEHLSNSYKIITDYIKANKLETYTPSREVYRKGPGMLMKGNPEKYETEILIPIK